MTYGLFLNSPAAQCSIHESGKMIYRALQLSKKFNVDYMEIDKDSRSIPNGYDFVAINYHPFTMDWLDTSTIRRKTKKAITFVLEALPGDPFPMCPASDFDAYCVLDPTMKIDDDRVHAFPRPLDQIVVRNCTTPDILTIGSFGFATPGKGFEHVVNAVNTEFEKAIVRINIPIGTHAGKHAKAYGEELSKRCIALAKPGVEVRITHDYMSKGELIRWCSENTLNCMVPTYPFNVLCTTV